MGIDIRNSKDHPDPVGNPFMSRVVVGGTIAELGIPTIGIAECIDPGNFSTDDTAVVLLDLLSAPASNPNSVLSLDRASDVSVLDAVARVVAAVISHEAGHFLGCWHTNNANSVSAIMDQGGDIANKANVGDNNTLDDADPRWRSSRTNTHPKESREQSTPKNVADRVRVALAVGTAPTSDESAANADLLANALQVRQAKANEMKFTKLIAFGRDLAWRNYNRHTRILNELNVLSDVTRQKWSG